MAKSASVHEPKGESEIVRFHCRMEPSIRAWYCSSDTGINNACHEALMQFANGIKGGTIRLDVKSRFLERTDKSQKVECILQLSCFEKDWLQKMAFKLHTSQTEVLRMALEWWMEAKNSAGDGSATRRARKKWHHGVITLRPYAVRYNLWGQGIVTMNNFPTQQDVEKGLQAISTA